MSIVLDDVEEVMRGMDFKFARTDDEHLLFGVRTDVDSYRIVLSLDEDGEYLSLATWQLLQCDPQHPNLEEILLVMARANNDYKVVQIGWNPADGDVNAVVAIPLEDNDSLGEPQFGQALATLVLVCDEVLPVLHRALAEEAPSGLQPGLVDSCAAGTVASQLPVPSAPAGAASVLAAIPRAAWLMFSAGVLLMGVAALLGVIHLYVR